jgi:eukaryotic-like serine/threonine-protein kinase
MGEFSDISTAVAERPALESGLVLANRYEVKRPLGRGGMGEVWLAYDLRLRVEVALKALLPRGARPESLLGEIRSAREVISPNVCRVFDLVEGDGRELLSMEFVDGTTLRQILDEQSPLDFFRAQEIAAQFLAGLEAIHVAGLVHRDFKPENVMLTRTGRVVVMDFGLARVLDFEPRSVAGTTPYMAPEQFLGRPADRRSDVFAVSVVLTEMLDPAGVRDLESRRRVWSSVRADPPQLADAPWSAVLRRGLAKDPDERYDSAAAMARALEEVRRRTGWTEEKSPYPGLGSFTEADAANFFGREAEVAEIWRSLSGPPRLLAVIGLSGAGKSSLMRAGVMAARPEGWRAVTMTPGPRPFASLASALAPDVAGDVGAVGALARLDEPGVAARLFAGWRKRSSGALLIIDQFEELFTLSSDETQSRFASIVGRLPIESDVHVVLSMRDDFLIRCRDHKDLGPVFSQLVPLQPLSGDALRRALVQPALNSGYRFEDEELVEEIVGQIAGERAALPLGAFAMARLWQRRDRQNGMLTRDAYREIGAVGGALAQHAEATLGEIGVERIGIVREIFRNLVTSHGTRASRERRELESLFPEGDAGVIDALVNARLLTAYERGRIEIVHESLLAAWPRLVQWQAQDADGWSCASTCGRPPSCGRSAGARRRWCGAATRIASSKCGGSDTPEHFRRARRSSRGRWNRARRGAGGENGSPSRRPSPCRSRSRRRSECSGGKPRWLEGEPRPLRSEPRRPQSEPRRRRASPRRRNSWPWRRSSWGTSSPRERWPTRERVWRSPTRRRDACASSRSSGADRSSASFRWDRAPPRRRM